MGRIRILTRATLPVAALAVAGCSTTVESRGPAEEVSLAEFSTPRGERSSDVQDPPVIAQAPPPAGADVPRADSNADETTDSATGASETAAPVRALKPGDRFVVDALVGQINGRPVFADEFLEPIEDRLIAEARDKTEREFALVAFNIIQQRLFLTVRDALFIAEAESGLTKEQQVGLRQFLGLQKERVVAERGGVEEQVRRELAEKGETLEGQLEKNIEFQLVRDLVQRRIASRVVVSWRDIEREYNREYWQERFNPPATVRLARIRLRTEAQAEQIEEVQRRLSAGEPFLEVAEAMDQPQGGLWVDYKIRNRDFSTIDFTNETLTEKVSELRKRGDTVGPFEIGSTTWWLHVAEYDQPPRRELYEPDVQRILASQIRARRLKEEEERYVARIMDEGIFDKIDDMARELVTIALLRYGPE